MKCQNQNDLNKLKIWKIDLEKFAHVFEFDKIWSFVKKIDILNKQNGEEHKIIKLSDGIMPSQALGTLPNPSPASHLINDGKILKL